MQVIDNIVSTLSSLIQWDTNNVAAADSSRYLHGKLLTSLIVIISINSVVESFEMVASLYAQQISPNETQSFSSSSLTLIAELVRYVDYNNVMCCSNIPTCAFFSIYAAKS